MKKQLFVALSLSSAGFFLQADDAVKGSPAPKPAVTATTKEKSPVVVEKSDIVLDGTVVTARNILIVDFFEAAEKSAFGQDTQKKMREKADSMAKELQQDERTITQAATEFKAKASTMNDSAREKEEQRLKKMQ
ncbi:MAG TPA: hypothetical protein VEK38_03395, partial [Candidatus Bathyarchaeia archaeon]|nr:hypothetical protein [Candidatus Bathyarchaeia archaeon]